MPSSPSPEQTFCIYCQEEYGTLVKLKRHLLVKHSGTYAAQSIAGERTVDDASTE